ncbi:MAG: YggT family protein [Verrucomicrobia bacterium]|nr:YggT family protein [Verrucomicrobiota bacterium]
MFQLVSILKGILEIVLFIMIGRGLLFVLAGRHREGNLVYKALGMVTEPINRLVRKLTPRFIVDAHVPFVTFFLLGALWFAALIGKLVLYRQLVAAATGG